jgi:hypothetical protein
MRSLPFIVLLSLIGFNFTPSDPAAAMARDDGTRLLQADSRGVTLEIRTGDPRLRPLPADAGSSELDVPGFALTGGEGEPGLPARVLWVGIPEGVTVRVEATAIESRSFEGVRLAPRMLPRQEGDDSPIHAAATSPERTADEPLAVLRTINGMRAQRVAAIEVRPARYDAQAQRLEVATCISVRISFVGSARRGPAPAREPEFEGIYRDLLVNYESARAFRRAPGGGSASRPVEGSGFDVASTWLRIGVSTRGVQQLRGEDLANAGVSLAGVDVNAIRLYTRPGLPVLPENEADPRGLAEVAIRIDDGGDGHLDPADRILFFGLAVSGWQDEYTNPGHGPSEWFDHPYETQNVYWLALDARGDDPPARWSSRDAAPVRADAQAATRYDARLHFEEDRIYQPDLGGPFVPWEPWVWEFLWSSAPPKTFASEIPGAIAGAPARLRARFSAPDQQFSSAGHRLDAKFNNQLLAPVAWSGAQQKDLDTTTTQVVDGTNRLEVKLARLSYPYLSDDRAYFLFWELRFSRRFEAVADTLEFSSSGITQPAAYTLAAFADAVPDSFVLLDVSDPLRPVELDGWQAGDTTGGRAVRFQDDRDSSSYFAASAPAWHTPTVERAAIRDIRRGGADYLVICSDGLEGDAMRLATHRSTVAPPFPGASSAVVRMSDILAWYAGGRMDPVAIRNFLHDAIVEGNWSPAPSYVCLLGDATYDFKNAYPVGDPGLARTQVPTFGHNFYTQQYPSDDWLVDVDLPHDPRELYGAVPDLIVGRLPAANASESAALVDKVIAYDAQPEYGPWRDRVLTLVDDMQQGFQADPLGNTHIEQADSLEHGHTPAWLDRRKVELIEYPFTQGSTKDGARQELLRQVDDGAVFWHYIGHGNPFKLADEDAFVLSDVAGLSNGPRLPFFFAASCDVGPFDYPTGNYLGEALVKRRDGGVIASYAGTILTFASSNFQLGVSLYDALFTPTERGVLPTIGEASFIAKHREFASQGDRVYHILGDPGTRLAMPNDDLRLEVFDDLTGEALGDSLPRGRRVRVEGAVHGTRDRSISDPKIDRTGIAQVRVTDAPVRTTVPGGSYSYGEAAYDANPRTAYDFPVAFSGGRFTARFTVPAEATLGPRARVSVYSSGGGHDGSGVAVVRMVEGVADDADSTGPALDVHFAGGGRVAAPEEMVTLTLEDPSGIRTMEDSPLDPVQVAFDGGAPIDVTKDFRSESATRGSVEFHLPALDDGSHRLTVTASDNLAEASNRSRHRSERSFDFEVAAILASSDARAFVLPNPFVGGAGTELVFTGIAGAGQAEVRVYDVRGSLVRTLAGTGEDGHVSVRWDGRNGAGAAVGAGIYLYRGSVASAASAVRNFSGRLVLLH